MKTSVKWAFAFILLLCLAPAAAFADIVNGDFETGDLTGWTTVGDVEVLQASNFSPPIAPFQGSYFALLSTGPGDVGLDRDGSGADEFDVTTMSQTFNVTEACYLKITVAGLATSESMMDPEYDDIFQVSIDGTPRLQYSIPNLFTSPWQNFGYLNGVSYNVSSSGDTNGSEFDEGVTYAKTFFFYMNPGVHTVEFLVADERDADVDTGLLIDGIYLVSDIPVGGSWASLALILVLLGVATAALVRRKGQEG